MNGPLHGSEPMDVRAFFAFTDTRDLGWKRKSYSRVASLLYYVVIDPDAVEVVVYARASNFAEQRLELRDATLYLPTLDISLPLAEIYHEMDVS